MTILYVILFLCSAGCFLLSFLGAQVPRAANLVSLGLFFWVLVPLIQALRVVN